MIDLLILQPRQLECIRQLAKGHNYIAGAEAMEITHGTFKNHVRRAKRRIKHQYQVHPSTERLVALYVSQFDLPE